MKKSLIITSMAALAALCFSLTAQAQGPVVVSDKDDYAPGETAMFSAAGFQPNELLDFSVAISDDQGGWIPDIAWAAVPADASGGAVVDYIVPQTWADKTLQLTVMGLTSGLMAQTTFTDTVTSATLNSPTTGSPVVVTTAGGMITANISYTTVNSPPNQVNVHFQIDGVDYPANQFSGRPLNETNVNYSVTVPAGLSVGCHDLKLRVGHQGFFDVTQTCAIQVVAPSPTPSPTATATPCQNTPPVITCASPTPNADLGEVVGCLGTGTGFGQTFDVTYDNNGPGTSVTVTAHFSLNGTELASVPVATVTDSNTVTVTQSGPTSVTINGPGSGSASFSVNIDADDGQDCNNTSNNMCGGTASADIVYHVHYLPPLYDMATTKVKQGSGVPVKMQLTDCSGTPITPDNIPGDTPTIAVTYLSGTVPAGPADVDDAGNSNGDTTFFRWSTDGPFWIFNLKTNNSYAVGATYEIEPSTVDNTAKISIK